MLLEDVIDVTGDRKIGTGRLNTEKPDGEAPGLLGRRHLDLLPSPANKYDHQHSLFILATFHSVHLTCDAQVTVAGVSDHGFSSNLARISYICLVHTRTTDVHATQ